MLTTVLKIGVAYLCLFCCVCAFCSARRPGHAHAVLGWKFRARWKNSCDAVVAEIFCRRLVRPLPQRVPPQSPVTWPDHRPLLAFFEVRAKSFRSKGMSTVSCVCLNLSETLEPKSMDRKEISKQANQEHVAFVAAIGQLTLAWSDLETVLFKLLKHYACVNDAVGRALFSGTRARASIAFIRAIADNTNMEPARRADLEEIFEQVGAINQTRDFVVHHVNGSEQEFEEDNPRERVDTDLLRVSRERNAKRVYVGSSTLLAMRNDCLECCWRLQAHWDPSNDPFKPGHGTAGVRSPWRFRSPQPVKKRS